MTSIATPNACEEPLLPYDYCINQLDFGDLIDSALNPTLKPGLQAAATAYLKRHDAYSATADPGLLLSANAYLSSLDIDAVPFWIYLTMTRMPSPLLLCT